jgi:murein DD-endopeptidase MepM/ murein hydrolase activator NlpD
MRLQIIGLVECCSVLIGGGEMRYKYLLPVIVLGCFLLSPTRMEASSPYTFTQVSAGWEHTCGVRTDGTLACWGDNTYGQATPPAGTFTQVSAGGTDTCGVRTGGTLACWGNNDYGQATPPAGTFTQVSAGPWHTCGVRTGGTLACWGNNDDGKATPPAGTFTQVSVAGVHACGVKTNGTLACWGSNYYGEATPPAGTFTQVSAGGTHTCGVKTNATLACWGDNAYGEATPPAGTFTQVSGGTESNCAVRTGGTLACWGRNDYGQATPPSGTFTQVDAGDEHTCAVRTGGTLVCWGDKAYGKATPPAPPTAVLSPLAGDAEVMHSLGACSDSPRWCFEQHRTAPYHAVDGGLCDSDDGDAWDSHPFPSPTESVPVRAVATGEVTGTYAGCTNAGGDWGEVLVQHGSAPNLWWSGYLHMDPISVSPGDPVDANTVLGYVSNKGTADRHLHFVVYVGSNVLDGLVSFDADILPRLGQSSLAAPASSGASILTVDDISGYHLADTIIVNPGALNEEQKEVIGFGSLVLDSPLQFSHEVGEPVVIISASQAVGGIAEYPELEPRAVASEGNTGNHQTFAILAVAGGVVLLAASAWYTRRRWLH